MPTPIRMSPRPVEPSRPATLNGCHPNGASLKPYPPMVTTVVVSRRGPGLVSYRDWKRLARIS